MKARKDNKQVGAVLVFALLILVVGATILGGIAQMAVTQSLAGRTEWDSAARRIRLENSRAMARQYVMSQMWQSFGRLPEASLGTNSTGGLGGFSITTVEPKYGFWGSLKQDGSDRVNPFNLFERGGFQSAWAAGTLSSGSGNVPWGFQVRTRSPVTAGFAFVNQRPTNNSWAPVPRMNMHQPADYAVGFTNLPRMPVSSVTNTTTGDTNGFLGFLSAPVGQAPFGNFYTDTTGVVTNFNDKKVVINLATFSYYNPDGCLFYEVPTSVSDPALGMFAVPVTKLELQGGPDGIPVQISVPAANNTLADIVLSGDNQRPVYIYHRGSRSVSISTSAASTSFRIGMTLFVPATFAPAGSLTIVGGVRTGQSLAGSQANVTFTPEANADWRYDAIADRMMWLEDQRAR